jgi:glucose dehydrogenase
VAEVDRRRTWWWVVAVVVIAALVIFFIAQRNHSSPPAAKTATPAAYTPGQPVADDGQWGMPAHDYASTRFSGLNEINVANVANLRPEFTFSTGVNKGHEAAPIIVGGTMFIVTPYPNKVYALDLTKPGAPL